MSLIALAIDPALGPPSVVTSSSDFSSEGAAVLIQNADPEQLEAESKDCNAGYDLRVGGIFRDHRNTYGQVLADSEAIQLLPGTAVIVQTEESVEFPKHRFGQIFPKVTLLTKGIANTTSKVDPGFQGPLLVTVFNLGKQTVSLHRRERFCSLNVFDVSGAVWPYRKPPHGIAAGRSTGLWRIVHDWIDGNVAMVTFVQTAFALLALVIAAVALAK
jgi:deoxycytidine triphosphate deaminase